MRRNKFNLSHTRLSSFDMGQLVPVGLVEVLPGDTFRHSSSVLLRIAATANPLMHQVNVRLHHWFISARVIWESRFWAPGNNTWDEFMNGSTVALTTQAADIDAADITAGSLANHLGLPVSMTNNSVINWLPFAGYQLIWNEYYRDQDLVTGLSDAWTESEALTLRRIAWEKDYFTTCRADTEFGTGISIPFEAGLVAPVKGIAAEGTLDTIQTATTVRENPALSSPETTYANNLGTSAQDFRIKLSSDVEATATPEIYADLAAATGGGIDVNEFRRAIAMQKFLEARNRFGSRYRDYLGYLGVRTRDGRLESGEFLGGGRQHVAFSEVLTTADSATSEVGDMSGHGIAAMRTRPYTKFFEEHGYVLSLISVRPKAMYQQMVPRHFFRQSKDDYWQKEYEMFGPQAVLSREVYGLSADATTVFGYQDRFREYREQPSQVSGLFASTLDDWHLAREFGATPTLNSTFVECTPTDRVYNDATQPECYAQVAHRISARRLVSKGPRI